MRRFLGPFRPFLGSVFECFSFFFTQKNSRFLPFFAVFCHIFRKNPALFCQNPALFRQNPALSQDFLGTDPTALNKFKDTDW